MKWYINPTLLIPATRVYDMLYCSLNQTWSLTQTVDTVHTLSTSDRHCRRAAPSDQHPHGRGNDQSTDKYTHTLVTVDSCKSHDNRCFIETYHCLSFYLLLVVGMVGGDHEGSVVHQETDRVVHVLTTVNGAARLRHVVHVLDHEVVGNDLTNHCKTAGSCILYTGTNRRLPHYRSPRGSCLPAEGILCVPVLVLNTEWVTMMEGVVVLSRGPTTSQHTGSGRVQQNTTHTD